MNRWIDVIRCRLRSLLRRDHVDRDLDRELRFHLAQRTEELVADGYTAEDARFAALREFGSFAGITEQCRDTRGTRVIDELVQDVRYAARVFRKSPGFVAAAVTSLALGIGANTAIFSLIDAAILKSLPVREPERLIELLTDRGEGSPFNAFSFPALVHFRDHTTTLDGVIASHRSRFFVSIDSGSPELGAGQYVTGNFFPVLGVPAAVGRIIHQSDDRSDAAPVAVLGHAYWHRRFAADPAVIGRHLVLDDHAFTIVGVASPAFRGTLVGGQVDFWIPLSAERLLRRQSWTASAGYKWLQILGRVRAGRTYHDARVELDRLFTTGVIQAESALLGDPGQQQRARNWRLVIEPASAGLSMIRRQYAEPLVVLLAISGIVLLVACVNVANLLLARASARRPEFAIRLSLGAARSRVVRQLLTESVLLSSAGAVLGLVLAYAGSRYLLDFFATSRTPITLDVSPDLRVLAFTVALGVATGLLFGLAPAWRATRQAPAVQLLGNSRVHGRDRRLLSRLLVGGQVALSVVMLFCGGLFLRSLSNLRAIDAGFDSSSVLLISTDTSRDRLTPEARAARFREALSRLTTSPGVESASLCYVAPIEGGGTMRTILVEGGGRTAPRHAGGVHLNWVSPGYFATMRTPIHVGRDFRWHESGSQQKVAIINQTMARQYFGSDSAIGRRVSLDDVTHEIVGVVGDAKYLELREAVPPTVYFNAFQQHDKAGQFAIRTIGRPRAVTAIAQEIIRAAAPSIAITNVRTLAEQVDASIVRERMLGALSGFFAGLGLLLAAVGLYGVMAYMVTRRTTEIGVRMALGARPSEIAAIVVREALLLIAGGTLVGTIAAGVLSRGLARLLFGLTPGDPLTTSIVIAAMIATGLAAAYLPSRRAARLDPTVALRTE